MRCIPLILFLSLAIANATTYIVAPSGGDYTTFAALQAAHTLAAGDIVRFQAASPGGSATFTETIQPNHAGAAGNPVTLTVRDGDTVTIDAQNTRSTCFTIQSTGYVVVDGFWLANATCTPLSGMITLNGSANCVIKNCHIHISFNGAPGSNDRRGIASVNDCSGIMVSNNVIWTDNMIWTGGDTDGMLIGRSGATHVGATIVANTITISNNAASGSGHNDGIQTLNCSSLVVASNNVYLANTNTSAQGQGIYTEWYNWGGDIAPTDYGNCYIFNNVVYGHGGSYVVQTNPRPEPNTKMPVVNIFVYNNTIDAFDYSSSLPFRAAHGGTYISGTLTVTNNIFVARLSSGTIYSFSTDSSTYSGANFACDYNHHYVPAVSSGTAMISFNGTTYTWAGWQASNNDTHGIGYSSGWHDPSFAGALNYQLSGTSPDLDTGANISSVFTTDTTGVSRPQGSAWDIGAYEFISSSPVTMHTTRANVGRIIPAQ